MKFDSKKNFYYNKDKLSGFFKQNPDCLSQNLYIEKQERLGIFKFGYSTINKVGCGAIAVYNVLKGMKVPTTFDEVICICERYANFGGKLGLKPSGVSKLFSEIGMRATQYFSIRQLISAVPEQGIIYYLRGFSGAHYISFTRAGTNEKGEPTYYFHNIEQYEFYDKQQIKGKTYLVPKAITLLEFDKSKKFLYNIYWKVNKK